MNAEPIAPRGDEHRMFDVRWRRLALAVLDDDDDRVLAAFEELEQAGRWTLAMAITTVTQRLVSVEVSARGEAAARSYLEGGLFDAAVNPESD